LAVVPEKPRLSPRRVERTQSRTRRTGGTIFFDTREAGTMGPAARREHTGCCQIVVKGK